MSPRASIAQHQQFDRNANDGAGWLVESDNALQSSAQVLWRARNLGTAAINAALSPTDRKALAVQVDGLPDQRLALANPNIRTNVGSIAGVSINDLDSAMNRIQSNAATVGARTNQLETLRGRTRVSGVTLVTRADITNDIESIDIANTATDLKLQELAYQASLAVAARVIRPSLMDFLR